MTELEPIFPFTVCRSGPQGSDAIYQLFLANRPKGETWAEYAATIEGRRKVSFVAYHRNTRHLGRGEEAFRISVECALGDTKEVVGRRLNALAEWEFNELEEQARREGIALARKAITTRNRKALR